MATSKLFEQSTISDLTSYGTYNMALGKVGNPTLNISISDLLTTLEDLLTPSLPIGAIVAWYGVLSSIPAHFRLCDGTNSTPDLTDRFIVGAAEDYLAQPGTNVTGTLSTFGGISEHRHISVKSALGTLKAYSSATVGSASESVFASNDRDTTTGGADTASITANTASYYTGDGTHIPPYRALYYIMKYE